MFQTINIALSLYNNENVFDVSEITKHLRVNPTAMHTKDENIVLMVKGEQQEIPLQYKETAWTYETGYIVAESIMEGVEVFLNVFGGKENIIRCLCDKYALQTEIMFVIFKNGSGHYPDMRIDNRCVKFIESINAGINFDILD